MGAFSSKARAYIIFEVSLCHPNPETCRMFILSKQRSGHITYQTSLDLLRLSSTLNSYFATSRRPTSASSPPLLSPSVSGEGYSGGGSTWRVEEVLLKMLPSTIDATFAAKE